MHEQPHSLWQTTYADNNRFIPIQYLMIVAEIKKDKYRPFL